MTYGLEFEDSKEMLRPFDQGSNTVSNSVLNVNPHPKYLRTKTKLYL